LRHPEAASGRQLQAQAASMLLAGFGILGFAGYRFPCRRSTGLSDFA